MIFVILLNVSCLSNSIVGENIKEKQIACKAEEPLYDLLILASDFDKEWAKSLRIKLEGDNLFSVSYTTKNKETKMLKIAMRKMNV